MSLFRVMFLAFFAVFTIGCSDPKPTGNATAAKAMMGKRVGLIVRTAKYLGSLGDKSAKQTYKHRPAYDAPTATYFLAHHSLKSLTDGLGDALDIVMLDKNTDEVKVEKDLVVEEDFVLMTPNQQRTTVPPDAKLQQIMESEKLDG